MGERRLSKCTQYIMNKPELLELIPTEVKDKRLVCWCKPEKCHGDILATIADNYEHLNLDKLNTNEF